MLTQLYRPTLSLLTDLYELTMAGRLFGIPVRGAHAHSWVMCFGDVLEAYLSIEARRILDEALHRRKTQLILSARKFASADGEGR